MHQASTRIYLVRPLQYDKREKDINYNRFRSFVIKKNLILFTRRFGAARLRRVIGDIKRLR
jgi:hypothetical protein